MHNYPRTLEWTERRTDKHILDSQVDGTTTLSCHYGQCFLAKQQQQQQKWLQQQHLLNRHGNSQIHIVWFFGQIQVFHRFYITTTDEHSCKTLQFSACSFAWCLAKWIGLEAASCWDWYQQQMPWKHTELN